MNGRIRLVRVGLSVLVASLALAPAVEAAGISIFTAPDKTYQNTTNNPCIFYGPGNCSDPSGWPAPAGDTQNFTANPLVQTYDGSGYSSWLSVVGTSFILGYDINQANGKPAQILTELTITFYDGSNVQLSDYTMTGLPLSVPANANGNGYADYVLAAGCSGVVTGTGVDATCSQYLPFLVPNGTTKIVMTFNMSDDNDGAEQIFAIPAACTTNCGPVPEPATGTLVALGSGLVAVAYRLRRRRRV